MRYLLFILIYFGLSTFCSSVLFAQEAAPADISTVYRTPELVIEAQAQRESQVKPSAFVSVIHPEQHQETLSTLPELLSEQPGVFVKGFGGLGQLSTVSLRGSSSEQVSVFLDGIKINTAQGGGVDFSTLPLGGVERIEVLRGGAASQFGSDAVGGVVNIITRKAIKKPLLEFKVSGGSFMTAETHEGFSKRWKKWGLTLDHTHFSSQGDFTFRSTGVNFEGGGSSGGGEKFTRLNNGFWSENFLARFDADLNAKLNLSLTNDFFYSSRDKPGVELETTQLYPKNPLEAHENIFRNSLGLQLSWNDAFVKNFKISLSPFYNLEKSSFADASPALGGPIDVNYSNQSVGVKTRFFYEVPFKKQHHAFTLLHDFRYSHFKDASPLAAAKLTGAHTRQNQGLFFQDEISLLGNRLYFNPSLRYEHVSDFGGDVAGHFGVVVKPLRSLSLKSNIENSFRYPNFNELFFPDQGYIRGNPKLKPERALNFDVGVGLHHRLASAELSYFRNAIEDSILFVPISAFTLAPVNTGKVTAQGLEFSATVKPIKQLELSGNYTFLNAKFKGSDKQLPGRPRHLANAKVEWKKAQGSLFAKLQYIDRLPIDFPNTKTIRNRTLIDLGGTIKLKEHYFLSAEAKNIGNVQTLDSVGFPLPRASVYLSFGYKS